MFHYSHFKPVLTSFAAFYLYVVSKMVDDVFCLLKYMKNISHIARHTAE